MQIRDIIIVGAGPAGLAAGHRRQAGGLDYSMLEKGVLVNSISGFRSNMVFFTTPELLEIGGLPLVSPFEKPTRLEALRYYRRVVDTYELADRVSTSRSSTSSPSRERPATAGTSSRSRRVGARRPAHPPRRNVVFAIGYFDHPNFSACPAKTCRTSPTTTPSRTVSTGSASSSSAAGTRRRKRRSSCFAPARTSRSCTASRSLKPSIKYWVRPDIENRIKEGSVAGALQHAGRRDSADGR